MTIIYRALPTLICLAERRISRVSTRLWYAFIFPHVTGDACSTIVLFHCERLNYFAVRECECMDTALHGHRRPCGNVSRCFPPRGNNAARVSGPAAGRAESLDGTSPRPGKAVSFFISSSSRRRKKSCEKRA